MHEENTTYQQSTLLDQIGLSLHHFQWRDISACDGYETQFFFEKYERDPIVAEQVDQLCATCPVTKECFGFGQETKSTGVFGGFYMENGDVKQEKNRHKSAEMAARLAKRVTSDE